MSAGLKDTGRRDILKKLGIGAAAVVAGPLIPSSAEGACTFDVGGESRLAADDRKKLGLRMKFFGAKPTSAGQRVDVTTIVQEVQGLSSCAKLLPFKNYMAVLQAEPSLKSSVYPIGVAPDRTTLSLAVTVLDSGKLGVVGMEELMMASASTAAGRCIIRDVNIDIGL